MPSFLESVVVCIRNGGVVIYIYEELGVNMENGGAREERKRGRGECNTRCG
jgi:hypothetical protein